MSNSGKAPVSQRIIPIAGLRRALRHVLLTVLSTVNYKKTAEALAVPRVQNLYFHFMPETEIESFRKLIKRLKQEHTFISYSEGIKQIYLGENERPYLTISFDDGFASNLRAAQVLNDEGISACFFVCPEKVGLSRERMLAEFPGEIRNEERMMDWDEIKELREAGHEVGSHTLSHRILSDLSLDEARHEIVASKRELEIRVGAVKHFAWPRGQFHHFRPELIDSVFDAGYESCASAVRGSHTGSMPSGRGCIRRENTETGWPLGHILYLIGRSTRKLSNTSGAWPKEWL